MAGGLLKFKGEAPVKKKKKASSSKKHKDDEQAHEEDDKEVDGWIAVPSPELALGPIYLTKAATSYTPSLCLSINPTTGKVGSHQLLPSAVASTSEVVSALDPDELEAAVVVQDHEEEDHTPSDVHHVWVCTRIPDTADKVTLRSATGKFLAADSYSRVAADREARAELEEWTLTAAPGARKGELVIKSSFGKALVADLVAGGKIEIRADGEGDDEVWKVWMQGQYLSKAKALIAEKTGKRTKATDGVRAVGANHDGLVIVKDLASVERENILKYQARGLGHFVGSEESTRALKRAREEGNLNETMLDRRTKIKSDRYC